MSAIVISGDTSGAITLQAPAVSGNTTLNLPTVSGGTLVTSNSSGNVGIGGTGSGQRLYVDSGNYLYSTKINSSNGVATALEVGNSTTRTWEFAVAGNTPAGTLPAGGMYFFDQSAAQARLIIDSGGRLTIPAQPAFFARKTNGGAMSPTNPVLFNDVVTNIGSYYNASTGRFTAPVAGTYYFISTAHCETTNNLARALVMYVNGVNRAYGYVLNATGARTRIVTVAILTLATNDYVTVGTDTSDFWAGDSSGINFIGYLIG